MFSTRFFTNQAVLAAVFIFGFHILAFRAVYAATANTLVLDTVFPFLCVIGIGTYITVLFTIWSAEEPVHKAVLEHLRDPELGRKFGSRTVTRFYGTITFFFVLTSVLLFLLMAGMPVPVPFDAYLAAITVILVVFGGRLDARVAALKGQPSAPQEP